MIGECIVSRLLNSMRPAGLERSLWSAGGQHLIFSFMVQLIHYFQLRLGNLTVQVLRSLLDSGAPAELRGLLSRGDQGLMHFFYSLKRVSVSRILLLQTLNKS